MQLKIYQQETLDVLKRFFTACRVMGAKAAFESVTSEFKCDRLGNAVYKPWELIPDVPRVCLKVPTGGGKTIIAAHAAKIVSETWLEREFPVVLWFTPSDTIRRQTAEALKNKRHAYREALDKQFDGKVRVFDLDEKFMIRPADIENNAVIIVATSQSFVKEDTSKYNVYRTNEHLEPHFARITANEGMETDENGRLKFSFANLLHYHTPLMIVDEAHNGLTDLLKKSVKRINPSAIVELTATPIEDNNTLYAVRAAELKAEEMIKLPIALAEMTGWETAVDEAIARRAELEKLAADEKDYIRPIILFQAQDKNGEVNVETLKNYLTDTRGLPEKEIKIATGDQKELDGINLFDRHEPTRFIITVEALKEGWDCSFAYVLCSLANVKSNTAVEQLLGRVMRMPFARLRKNPSLNKAYAFVLSKTFGEAAKAIVDKLIKKGFGDEEARSAVEIVQPHLFEDAAINKVKIVSNPLISFSMPSTILWNNANETVEFTRETKEDDVLKLCEKVNEYEANELKTKFIFFRKREDTHSPAKSGERFIVPRMMVEIQGMLEFADAEIIFENFDWDITAFSTPTLEADEFEIMHQGNDFVIDIDNNRLQYAVASARQTKLELGEKEEKAVHLVSWLDRKLKQADIPQMQMVNWLRQTVDFLLEKRGISLSELFTAKYALVTKLESKIAIARLKAKNAAFQQFVFGGNARLEINFDQGFVFRENMYDGEQFYNGRYKFTKHFLGEYKVPLIDGGENGEEFFCAKVIDSMSEVKYWLRNVARHPNSFWLPTSTDKFYPDFVALLNDGRILVVEYKGEHLKDNDDTKEKELVGQLWEKQSASENLFLMVYKTKGILGVAEQIKQKVI